MKRTSIKNASLYDKTSKLLGVRRGTTQENTQNEMRELTRRTTAWFSSEAGQKSLKESERRISEIEALLKKGRDIDWKKLNEPFTI